MKRRTLLLSLMSAAVVGASPACSQSSQDQIVRELQEQGFRRIRVSRTLLGRVRIVATAAGKRRELILNPSTGAILRDYWVIDRPRETEGDDRPRVIDPDDDDYDDDDDDDDDRGRGRGRGGDDDDDDDNSGSGGDDDDDDDDDDDNSGSGGDDDEDDDDDDDNDNSGSGGGGGDDNDDDDDDDD